MIINTSEVKVLYKRLRSSSVTATARYESISAHKLNLNSKHSVDVAPFDNNGLVYFIALKTEANISYSDKIFCTMESVSEMKVLFPENLIKNVSIIDNFLLVSGPSILFPDNRKDIFDNMVKIGYRGGFIPDIDFSIDYSRNIQRVIRFKESKKSVT